MFLTKFVRKDEKPDEDYWYQTAEEALHHLSLFVDDDSDLYKRIVASDEGKNTVLQILTFDAHGKATSFKVEDVVRFKPEFCSEGERKYIFAITNLNDRNMRATIVCLNSGMAIPGSETVELNAIAPVGTTLTEIIAAGSGEKAER